MNSKELIVGCVYYSVSYAECDSELSTPLIDTFIYLGRDIEVDNTWVFQDAESYINHGLYLDAKKKEEEIVLDVYELFEYNLRDIISIENLIELLTESTSKAQNQVTSRGQPT